MDFDRRESDLGAFSQDAGGTQDANAHPVPVRHASPLDGVPPEAVQPVDFREFHRSAVGQDGESRVCSARKTMGFLRGAFVELVRHFYRYRSPYLLGVPSVRWSPNTQETGIWIDSEYVWNQDHPEFLPALYVGLKPLQYQSELGSANRNTGMVLRDAVYTFQRGCRCAVSFTHVSGTAGEAEALCDNTRSYLSDFCWPISDDLCLDEFQEASASPAEPAQKDSKDRYMSSSTFSFSFYEEWSVKLDSPILRSVDLLRGDGDYGILSAERVAKPAAGTRSPGGVAEGGGPGEIQE